VVFDVVEEGEKGISLDTSTSDSGVSSSPDFFSLFLLKEFLKKDLLVAAFGTNVLLVLLVLGASVVEVLNILNGLLLLAKPNLRLLGFVIVSVVFVFVVVVIAVGVVVAVAVDCVKTNAGTLDKMFSDLSC